MTRWTGKVVGGVIGAMALGPVGAALGAIFGHQFDTHSDEPPPRARRPKCAEPWHSEDRSLLCAYGILAIDATATDAEVVKAYRRQLSRHHPDKLQAQGVPKHRLEEAKARTQAIIEAYGLIRERRGMS